MAALSLWHGSEGMDSQRPLPLAWRSPLPLAWLSEGSPPAFGMAALCLWHGMPQTCIRAVNVVRRALGRLGVGRPVMPPAFGMAQPPAFGMAHSRLL